MAALAAIGADLDRFIGFELGAMFVPYGRIYSLDAYAGVLDIAVVHRRQALLAQPPARVGPPARCATSAAPTSWCSPATTWPSTW